MKKMLISTIISVLIFSLVTSSVLAQESGDPSSDVTELAEHVPGEVLIRFFPGVSSAKAANIMAEMGVTHKREIPAIGVHLVKLPPGLSVELALDKFSHRPGLEFVEPNYILQIAAPNHVEEITDQWGLEKIQAEQAWSIITKPEQPIVLATVDTGVDRTHTDLMANMWANSDELPGDGIDNDANGYIDDTWGWDFVNNDNDPFDDNLHGTAVSSVMAGVRDGSGVAGVCPWCQVMAVKVMGADGFGALDIVSSGIIYAANSGARVINLSLAGSVGGSTLENAVNYAWSQGALIVGGAGNSGVNSPMYPAGYTNVMAIGSTGESDTHSCFSNYGENYISVVAPGEGILVALPDQGYGIGSGTSLSTPHVAGLGGLLFSQNPDLLNTEARTLIENTSVDLGPTGFDAVFGHGRIDAFRAVTDDETPTIPPDGLFSISDTATGYAHARKLVRDNSGTLHLIWHTKDGLLYRIRYATSSDDGNTWNLQPDVFSSTSETYHPALVADDDYLYVAIPSRIGAGLPYQILFTRKPLSGGEWSSAISLMGGTVDTVRPDLYVDPSTGRLHVIASSLDNSPYLYYRVSNTQGETWENLSQFNPSNSTSNTRYAAIHANGDNIYIATKTVAKNLFYAYYYLYTARSTDGGQTWIDKAQLSWYLAFTTSEYGLSLAGVGDRVYMGYEVGSNLYFRRYDGAGWSDYLPLDTEDPNIIYKWPTITQADDGQAWMIYELNKELYIRHYDGSNWQAEEKLGNGSYANLKLGTSANQVEWVYTTCNGSPFGLGYDSLSLGANSPPQANDQSVSTEEDTPINITLTGSDLDDDPLIFQIVTEPSDGILTGTPPNMLYTPNQDFNGSDSFTFNVNDGQSDSSPATVWITITPVDDPPLANAASVTTSEDTPVDITLIGTDPDGDELTFNVISSPSHGVLNGSPPNLIYTPDQDYHGADSFTFNVNDGQSDSSPATVSITIDSVNDTPVANDEYVSTSQDTPVAITLTGSDLDGDSLAFSIVSYPSYGTLSGTLPNITYTPFAGYSGLDSFTFVVNDGVAISAQATVSITIAALSMHVGDLDAEALAQPRNRWDAAVNIAVHNSDHAPVPNVTVNGSWSNGATGGASCVTNSNGTCTVTKSNLRSNVSEVSFTVDDISHATQTYDASANHDPDEDSTGTTIIIYQNGPPGNQPPLASFTYHCTDLSCNFDASGSSDPDGSIVSYTWDFGDSRSGNGLSVNHTYSDQGTYTVVLTVTDDEGGSATESQQIFLGNIQVMHVGDLDGNVNPGIKNRWDATVVILVHNDDHYPVAGVTVSGTWSTGRIASCITGDDGLCNITLTNIKNDITSITFSVTELAASGWEYYLQSNHDPDTDSNGTAITITQQ